MCMFALTQFTYIREMSNGFLSTQILRDFQWYSRRLGIGLSSQFFVVFQVGRCRKWNLFGQSAKMSYNNRWQTDWFQQELIYCLWLVWTFQNTSFNELDHFSYFSTHQKLSHLFLTGEDKNTKWLWAKHNTLTQQWRFFFLLKFHWNLSSVCCCAPTWKHMCSKDGVVYSLFFLYKSWCFICSHEYLSVKGSAGCIMPFPAEICRSLSLALCLSHLFDSENWNWYQIKSVIHRTLGCFECRKLLQWSNWSGTVCRYRLQSSPQIFEPYNLIGSYVCLPLLLNGCFHQ